MPWRPGKPGIRLLAAGVLILAAVRNGEPSDMYRDSAPEYSVKAAYLYHFVQYVTWPDGTFDSPDSPVVIGILGKDPFGSLIDRALAGRTALGRRIEVRRVALEEASRHCQVVFISRQDRAMLRDWLKTLRAKPILSVTESPEAFSAGAAINFLMEGSGLRYEINLECVKESKLHIATPMLLSALRVLGAPAEER